MMCGITGTPGTGKSSAADELALRGYYVVRLTETIKDYVVGEDRERDSRIIDEDRWAREFIPVEGFVEGHLAHLLPCDRVVILRCRPDILLARLRSRGYREEKSRENAEAEALAARGVVVRSCRSFLDLEDHCIRVSIGEDWENERFISEINKL